MAAMSEPDHRILLPRLLAGAGVSATKAHGYPVLARVLQGGSKVAGDDATAALTSFLARALGYAPTADLYAGAILLVSLTGLLVLRARSRQGLAVA